MRIWEPGCLWLQSVTSMSLRRPGPPPLSGAGLLPSLAALGFSTTQPLQRFWELNSSNNNSQPLVRTECSPARGCLSPLCKSFTVYKGSFHWPRSCSSRMGVQGNDSGLHSAHICSQGPPDMCVYEKDCITQVIIILLQRRARIYCSGVSYFSYRPWKMFLQTKLQNTELPAKVCAIYHLTEM